MNPAFTLNNKVWCVPNLKVLESIKTSNTNLVAESQSAYIVGNVGIITVNGYLSMTKNSMSELFQMSTIEGIIEDIDYLNEQENITTIVLKIDSGGGEAKGLTEVTNYISNNIKPIIAYNAGDMQSGALWLGVGCSKIVAAPEAFIGSIGAVMGVYTDDDPSIVEFVSSQSPLKRIDPAAESGRNEYQTQVDDVANLFINTVAEKRKVSPEYVVENFGSGGSLISSKALSVGLIDEISTFNNLLIGLQGESMFGLKTKQVVSTEVEEVETETEVVSTEVEEVETKTEVVSTEIILQIERARIKNLDCLKNKFNSFSVDVKDKVFALIDSAKFESLKTAEAIALDLIDIVADNKKAKIEAFVKSSQETNIIASKLGSPEPKVLSLDEQLVERAKQKKEGK